MKTNPAKLLITTTLFAIALSCRSGFSQPTSPGIVDPATGVPALQPRALARTAVSPAASPGTIDPATGLPISQAGELTPETALNAEWQTANEVRQLIFNLKYEEALKLCLAFHNKWKTSASLSGLLSEWIELGRRYPRAKTALVGIRDQDAREFKEGRGYFALFQEIHAINSHLQQDDATYELFKSFRDEDPKLGQQCYIVAEDLVVAHGDYQWCYDHMGDPQSKFDFICGSRKLLLQLQERNAVMAEETQKRLAQARAQNGLTNTPAFSVPDPSRSRKAFIDDRFVGQVRQMMKILSATGHESEAEKIRAQAATILDDPRLKS
jgi:hypothetical protein